MGHLACIQLPTSPASFFSHDMLTSEFREGCTGKRGAARAPPWIFGLKGAARLKDAFKRPFRTVTAGDAPPAVLDADGLKLCITHSA